MTPKRTMMLAAFLIIVALYSAACSGLSTQARTASTNALRSLRKVDAATQVGVSYQQYQPLIIEAQAQVDEALAIMPNGESKLEIKAAMTAYSDALEVWREKMTGRVSSNLFLSEYQRKYPELGTYTYEYDELMSKLWVIGHQHIDKASSLLSQ